MILIPKSGCAVVKSKGHLGNAGLKEIEDRIWLVSFMAYDLGYFDHETCRLEPLENPFGPKVSPMSQE